MFMVESKEGAIACMLSALVFLGTWPAILNFLERKGRLPQHTYLDYSITNFVTAVALALTVGQIGEDKPDSPNFLTQLRQISGNWPCVLLAMIGGIFLSVGNLSMQYALAIVGLSVTEVITSSIAVVLGNHFHLGTTLNYFLDDRINKAEILFPGVGCFLVAVCLGSAVHTSNTKDITAKLRALSGYNNGGEKGIEMSDSKEKQLPKGERMDLEHGSCEENKPEFGSADYLVHLENKRAIKVLGKSVLLGIGITFFGGGCYALFSPTFNLATNDQWHLMKNGVSHLVVYTAFFYFSLSFVLIALLLNIIFLYHPVLNLPKSSVKEYLSDWKGREWALLAGVVCGLGNGLQFMGGQAAGYAAADCVQALPLVSTFWGILVFGEYRKSSQTTYALLGSMLLMFIVAVAVLMASSGHRNS